MSLAHARSSTSRRSDAWIEETSRSLTSLANDPVRVAFLRRALGELLAFAKQDESVLLEALATPTQVSPMLRALDEQEFTASARWTRARDAGRQALLALLDAEGGVLTPEQVSERLSRTRQAVHQRQRKGQLLAVPGVRGAVYPVWQFTDDGVLPGFPDVLEALGETPPAMAVQFFLTGRDALGGERPLEALRAGRVTDVRRAAGAFSSER
ncbi:MAG: hypothetical protein V4850_21645 [Myxococcota bacterium]